MKITGGYIRYKKNGKEFSDEFKAGDSVQTGDLDLKWSSLKKKKAERVTLTSKTESPVEITEFYLKADTDISSGSKICCNGFQSWTDSREFSPDEKMPPLFKGMHLLKMNYYGDYHFYKYSGKPGVLHGYNYSYIKNENGTIDLAASADEKSGYTIFEYDCNRNLLLIRKECAGMIVNGSAVLMDIILSSGEEDESFDSCFAALKKTGKTSPLCTGWTSWYNYYTDITQDIIIENLKAFTEKKIPIDTFQIDDGYQKKVGDWLDIKDSFPEGMGFIASSIKKSGFKAGLWLAPFICEKDSRIFKRHPDWLLYDEKGKPVPGGWNPGWSGDFYVLDIYKKEVLEYLKKVFDTVLKEWKFDMVKLDFLYAAALYPREGKTRGRIMADAMELLRSLCGKKIILGCGVPLGQSFGIVDYCRIGGDVALRWEDWRLQITRYRERVSTVNSLTSTIGRRHLNGRVFLNDPDVFILREENCDLTRDQKNTLFMLNNLFGGLVFCSDNLNNYSQLQLDQYKQMFPLKEKNIESVDYINEVYKIKFYIGDNEYIVYSNFSKGTRTSILDKGNYFFKNRLNQPDFVKGASRVVLKPFESRCYFKITDKKTGPAGSTAHLFPCSEIESLKISGKKITFKMDSRHCGRGGIFFKVPDDGKYTVNGNAVEAVLSGEGVYTVYTDII